ncbi:MAG: hypothetical protein JO227_04800 [Acetobacteraceae bacterium]|nr:hypothetical protein [Acetobacteraceae bacterium]
MNKKFLFALATIAALASGPRAFAEGEGNGPDFPGLLQAQGVLANPTVSAGGGSEAYPVAIGTTLNPVVAGHVLAANGSEALVQTANSLPLGFTDGTPAAMYAQSMQRYWAQHQPSGFARATQPGRPNG